MNLGSRMRISSNRRRSKQQLRALRQNLEFSSSAAETEKTGFAGAVAECAQPRDRLSRLIAYSGLDISRTTVALLMLGTSISLSVSLSRLLTFWVMPIVALAAASTPIWWLAKRARIRAASFAADYPTMLLASASSLKAGLTPYQALQRSVQLLSESSPVKNEVSLLLKRIDDGQSREVAVDQFGETFNIPELFLFRRAFLLVLENGGRFAPTLSRLANVSYSRAALIESAAVSTANMRMTANILLLLGPMLLLLMTIRGDGYWETLTTNPLANTIGSMGALLLLGNLALLRWMSVFKP